MGRFEADQDANPAFKGLKLKPSTPYRRFKYKIKKLIDTLDNYQRPYECLQTDDEDCEYQLLLTCTIHPLPTPTSPTHGLLDTEGSADLEGSADVTTPDGSGGLITDTENPNNKKELIQIIVKLAREGFAPVDPESSITTPTPTAINTPKHNADNTTNTGDTEDTTKPQDDEEDVDYEPGEAPGMEEETPTLEGASETEVTTTITGTTTTQVPTGDHQISLNPSGVAPSLSSSVSLLLAFATATLLAINLF